MNQKFKLIALDLDGTTLNRKGQLTDRTKKALMDAIAEGIHVVIASGRSFASLPKSVVTIPGIEYAITSNGAAIYHVPTGRRVHGYTIEPADVQLVLDHTSEDFLKGEVIYEAFVEGIAYADISYVKDPVKYGALPAAVEYVKRTRHMEEDIRQFIKDHIENLDSIDVVVKNDEMKAKICNDLAEKIDGIYITSSVSQLIEISHHKAGKHSGLKWIVEKLGVDVKETVAFGNADNDIDMMMYAGLGVAVGNADEKCRQMADYVCESNDADGVAKMIEQWL